MPRSAVLSQKMRDDRQEQITKAALRVFANQGLAATKISDIAATARVSHGLVNHYFGSKDELYTQVVRRALQGGLHLVQAALAGPGTPWERLEQLCQAMVNGIVSEPEYLLLVVQVSVDDNAPAEARCLLADYGQQIVEALAALIREGQQAGQVVAGDPALLVETFMACIQGLGVSRVAQRGGPPPPLPQAELVLRLLKA